MSENDLINSFEFIGQQPSNNIIKKCLEICSTYNIDAEELVEHWSAFSMTYLRDTNVSLEGITSMEQKILYSKKSINIAQEKSLNTIETYNQDTSKKLTNETKKSSIPDNTSSEVNISKSISEHDNKSSQNETNEKEISPLCYADRISSEKVVASFGKNHDYTTNNQVLSIKVHGKLDWYKPDHFNALYTTQTRIANSFDNKIDTIGRIILKKNKLDLSESEGNVVVYGRIKSEDRNEINNKTVILETSRDFKGPREIVLNITNTQNYSIFSGQIVAVRSVNMSRNLYVAQEIYSDASPEFISQAPSFNENLQIVVAAGPYTISDNLSYEPLQDLLERVVHQKPNILILIGPFIDATQPNLLTMTETFERYFEILIENIIDRLVGWPIQVILVPSSNDAHHFPIYPTPCYMLKHKNLICVPNPSLLDVNGLIIGITSLDILFQLTKEEISRNDHTDRMTRLASHLISQRSFFPLYPNRDTSLCIDYERLHSDCVMDVKPHLLILPSTLRCFVENVNNCLVLNPERLVKNHVGGTYATINVNPSLKPGNMIDYISCQIKNI